MKLIITSAETDPDEQMEARRLRETDHYYRSQPQMINKACFIPSSSSHEYQNISTDSAFANEMVRKQTANYKASPRKNLIEFSFDKMKLNGITESNESAMLFHKRNNSGASNIPYQDVGLNPSTKRPTTQNIRFTPRKTINKQISSAYR